MAAFYGSPLQAFQARTWYGARLDDQSLADDPGSILDSVMLSVHNMGANICPLGIDCFICRDELQWRAERKKFGASASVIPEDQGALGLQVTDIAQDHDSTWITSPGLDGGFEGSSMLLSVRPAFIIRDQ